MSKQAVSVTLAVENLLWLRAQTHIARARSVSATLDRLVSAARASGQTHESSIRSVVGTVRVSDADPGLLRADTAVRALFERAAVAEPGTSYARVRRASAKPARRGRKR